MKQRDLDADYDTPERALQAFSDVNSSAGRKLLYGHTKDLTRLAESTQTAVRDKANQILSSASIAIALVSGFLALLQTWGPRGLHWSTVVVFAIFVWVLTHFWRALVLSIKAITRDEVVLVSTQEFVDAVRNSERDLDEGKAYLLLAGHSRSASTATNQRLLERINMVILAQTSFRWGLILLPVLLLTYSLLTIGHNSEQAAPITDNSVEDVVERPPFTH